MHKLRDFRYLPRYPLKNGNFMSSPILFLRGGCGEGGPWPLGGVWLTTGGLTNSFYGVGGINPPLFLFLLGELGLASLLLVRRCLE